MHFMEKILLERQIPSIDHNDSRSASRRASFKEKRGAMPIGYASTDRKTESQAAEVEGSAETLAALRLRRSSATRVEHDAGILHPYPPAICGFLRFIECETNFGRFLERILH